VPVSPPRTGPMERPAQVGIVIPTRNRLPLLRDALRSIERQSLRDWSCVVVDDASSDGTDSWLAGVSDPRFKVIRSESNLERSTARNVGLEHTRAAYVTFLDDDDLLVPHALSSLLAAAKRQPNAVAVVGGCVQFDSRGHRHRVRDVRKEACRVIWPEVLAGWVAWSGRVLYRRQVLDEIGGWDDTLVPAEDQDILLRASVRGPVVVIPDIVLLNRVGAQGHVPRSDVLEATLRARFVGSLDSNHRGRAEQIIEWRRLIGAAADAYRERRFSEARHLLAIAGRTSSRLMRSPLVGPSIRSLRAKVLIGSLVGGRLFDPLVKGWHGFREFAGKAPRGSGEVEKSSRGTRRA
jgi:glycosyltransferase involved in cell wall biosynthesis